MRFEPEEIYFNMAADIVSINFKNQFVQTILTDRLYTWNAFRNMNIGVSIIAFVIMTRCHSVICSKMEKNALGFIRFIRSFPLTRSII